MIFKKFLIKYAEIGVKGKNRYLFENSLVNHIRHSLKRLEGSFQVYKEQGRIFIDCLADYDYEETVDCLSRIFGISGICPVVEIPQCGLEEMGRNLVEFVSQMYPAGPRTFKVCARRSEKAYPYDSMQINREMGGVILDAFPDWKVDVHTPEVELVVEVRKSIYLYSLILPGAGGLPLGTAGKAMLLLSGGIDSPVAGYMIARRGVSLDAVYFHAPPYTSERAKQKVVDLAKIIARYTGTIYLHVVNFTDIQLAIYDKCPHDELTIIMRRYMMRIAEHFAKEGECLGLVTGESIGQVASQTMQSLACTNAACTMPVYRPLAALDKQDIINISEKIGAYETSILPYEDCCTIFVAKHPVTKPNLKVIEKSEENLKDVIDELMEKAIAEAELIQCFQ